LQSKSYEREQPSPVSEGEGPATGLEPGASGVNLAEVPAPPVDAGSTPRIDSGIDLGAPASAPPVEKPESVLFDSGPALGSPRVADVSPEVSAGPIDSGIDLAAPVPPPPAEAGAEPGLDFTPPPSAPTVGGHDSALDLGALPVAEVDRPDSS